MNESVQPWLPAGALSPEAIGAALRPVVHMWSETWFPAERAELAAARREASGGDRVEHEGLAGAIILAPRARRHLLEAALAVDLSSVSLTETDRPVLDRFVDGITRDLLARLAFEPADAAGSSVAVSVVRRGQELLTLSLPAIALIPRLKATFAKRRSNTPLVSRSRALGRTTVTLNALLGRGVLNLHELDGISAGDVILLDRHRSERIDLHITGTSTVIASGTLERAGDHPSLRL